MPRTRSAGIGGPAASSDLTGNRLSIRCALDKYDIYRQRGKEIYLKVVQDLRIMIFEMYSERFDPAPPPSRENSACATTIPTLPS